MAEAFLNKNFPNCTTTKKRKIDLNQGGGKKRCHTVTQASEDVIVLDPRLLKKVSDIQNLDQMTTTKLLLLLLA